MIFAILLSLFLLDSPTAQYGNSRTGANTTETILNPTSINAVGIKLLGTYTIDGAEYSQPLYVFGKLIGGKIRDILIVATMHDSIYAFDADRPGTAAFATQQAVLHVYDSSLTELWSTARVSADRPGNLSKFSAPLVINGKVYLASVDTTVYVYGLAASPGIVIP